MRSCQHSVFAVICRMSRECHTCSMHTCTVQSHAATFSHIKLLLEALCLACPPKLMYISCITIVSHRRMEMKVKAIACNLQTYYFPELLYVNSLLAVILFSHMQLHAVVCGSLPVPANIIWVTHPTNTHCFERYISCIATRKRMG